MNLTSTTILMAAMLCATIAGAQPGDLKRAKGISPIYIRVGAGYGFVHAGQMEMNGKIIDGSETSSANSYSVALKPASFGSGACADIAGGYMITKHIGLELGIHAVVAPTKYSFTGLVSTTGLTLPKPTPSCLYTSSRRWYCPQAISCSCIPAQALYCRFQISYAWWRHAPGQASGRQRRSLLQR